MNTPKDITNLYNALFNLEAKYNKNKSYPIHKRLELMDENKDIYQYLISKIDVKNKNILDAGCGVGFGSLLFVQEGAKYVKGISISNLEIESANTFKSKSGYENIDFEMATFDEITKNSYDLIFCVESLKHSLNFETSYKTLLKALKVNGKLIIVDDFFEGKENNTTQTFMKDWNLNFLISINNLKIDSDFFTIELEDLTKWMKTKSLFLINMRIMLFKCLKSDVMLKKLFKGGLLLDQLYAKKQMKYQLVVISKLK